ncbi:MAG: chromosome segregation protein SMC [Candidatus Aminicenantes bacterium]|nr:chromosome segregation protein SMC [Candidatus Aminicenantes bacterium]
MIIKKLELQGFKSFPEKTKLIFHPGITCIIGPNGTGKSNLVDALLWVLRGGRIKALRGERSGDVIFNGNEKKAPVSMADVNLYLGNEDKDMKVNHRVFRSGESEYRMDGKRVRLKDIQDTLWKESIGETNYFVIEQGSIGAFLSSKPMEKRSLLEEAAGTAFYKEKKRQAENKLENTEQNLLRLEDIIGEVSKAKNSLQRQAREARRYRKLREQSRELTLQLYRKKLHRFEDQHKQVNENYQKHLDIERGFLNRLKTGEKELADIRKKVWMSEKGLDEEKEQLYSLKSQYSKLESDQDREAKRIDYFEEKKQKAKQELKELQQEQEDLKNLQTESEQSLRNYQKELEHKQDRLKKAEKSNRMFQKKLDEKEKLIQNLRDQYYQKISSHTEVKNNEAKLEKEIELIQKQMDKIDSELNSEVQNLSEVKTEINQAKNKMTQTQKTVDQNTQELDQQQDAVTKTSRSMEQLENQITALSQQKAEHSHHLKSLEKLMHQEKESLQIPELQDSLQMLADHMDSDEKDALLVDVFYKQEAKSFLIKPKDFIQHLSKGRLKGHFLLLAPEEKKQKDPDIRNEPQALGLLKAKIKAKPTVKPYLTFVPEAVIVKDLKDAVDLWIQHPEWNFITPQGDVLLSSGLVKSGEKKEGLFALSKETKAAVQKIKTIEDQIKPLESQLKEQTEEKENLEQSITRTRSHISKQQQSHDDLTKDVDFAEERKKNIESKVGLLRHEKQKLKHEQTGMAKQKNDLGLKIQTMDERIQTLKTTIQQEEKNQETLKTKREQENQEYYEIKTEIDVLSEKRNSITHQNKKTEQRIHIIDKKLKSLEQDIRESDKEKQHLKEKITLIKDQLKTLEQTKSKNESALTDEEEKLHEIEKQLSAKEEKIKDLREEAEHAKENRIKWEIKKAEKERDLINCEETCWQELKKTPDEVKKETSLPKQSKEDLEQSLAESKEKLEKIGSVNLMAEEEYNSQKKRYDFLIEQRQDLRESIQSTEKAIQKIDQESKSQFLKALIQVNQNFQDVFSLLFEGGNAQIKLSDEDDPLESGLDIIAQPPGKKVKNLSLLSGGEKTLTSLAFFFALFRYKPAPFCILDEVDAALDETNLDRFLNLMKEIKNQTQFIIITHNFKTMEVADYIYGTAMTEPNITDMYSVRLKGKKIVKDS